MKVYVTDHAIDRYIERVKDHYEKDQARKELIALCEQGQPITLEKYPHLRQDREYFELSEGIYVSAVEIGDDTYRILTLLTRGGLGEDLREKRNARNKAKRYRRGRKHRSKGAYDRHADDWGEE